MQTSITGSANGEILNGSVSWERWTRQIGGFCAINNRGVAHIDSRHNDLGDAWRSAHVQGRTLLIVEPSEFVDRIGQTRTGRVLAGFWA